ncbi:MAG: MXAN_6640 family putative metalloprotease, partial [Chloroflexota bacterium]
MLKQCLIVVLFLALFSAAQAQDTQSHDGHIDGDTPSQDFPVTLKSGDVVKITTTTPESGGLDTVLNLYNPAGESVAMNDDAYDNMQDSQIVYVVPEGGDYRINVMRYDDSTEGDYRLDVKIGDDSLLKYDVHMTGTELTRDSEHFRFHYTKSGSDAVTSAFLGAVVRAFENAWHVEIDKLGWPKPPSDGVMGGSDLYDIYVMDVVGSSDEALGITSPEADVADNPNTSEVEDYASTSYIAIDNDFHDVDFLAGQDAVTVMRSTAVHEFHHAIQMGYDGNESHSWLSEATATWMESIAAGKDQDATGYVETAFQYPEVCFGSDSTDSTLIYGEWPFLQLLTDDFGKDAVMNLWRQIADFEGFDALEHYLRTVDTDVPHELARYRIKNLARDYK